jgi:hypothetical protein
MRSAEIIVNLECSCTVKLFLPCAVCITGGGKGYRRVNNKHEANQGVDGATHAKDSRGKLAIKAQTWDTSKLGKTMDCEQREQICLGAVAF